MRYLKTYKLFESSNIEADLEDIFLDVKDNHPEEKWYVTMDHYEYEDYYSVYISFGSKNPWGEDSEDEVIISKELIECIHRVKDFMNSNGYGRLDVCILFEYESGQPDIDTISLDDLKEGQRLGESQSIKLLFRKDSVNEELLASTYISAANKLRNLGHIRRSTELQNWAKEAEEKRKREEELLRKTDISQFPPFRLQFYKGRWDSTQKRTIETLLVDGLFYIEPNFTSDWLSDMMWDHESDQSGLCLYIEFGTMPADEETQKKWNEIKGQISVDEWQGMAWTTRLSMLIFSENSFEIMTTGKCFWESVENENFVFSDRSEAIRFRKYFIEALEGKNLWGKNKWKPQGLKGQFDTFFQKDLDWREKERADGKERREQYFKPEHMPILVNRVRTGLSINDLYRN